MDGADKTGLAIYPAVLLLPLDYPSVFPFRPFLRDFRPRNRPSF
jgi:hypothetical protein